MNFTNPTAGGRIQAQAEPWDGVSIRVTRDCAGHRATNQGCALDLGDGKCTRPVLAAAAGTVIFRDQVQGVIRIRHSGGWQSDYAHMSPLLVGIGQTVVAGQQIGEISDAHDPAVLNFSGCHLHFGILLNGVEQDPWPYLNQTQETTDMLKGTIVNPVQNRFAKVKPGATALWDPNDVGKGFPITDGRNFVPDWLVTGATVNGSNRWYGGFTTTAKGQEFVYLHETGVEPLRPIEAGGITQDQLMDEKVAAAKAGAEGAASAAVTYAKSLPTL